MPFSPLSFRPPQLIALEGWLRESATAVSASVIESAAWMAGRDDLTVDGIHFNDEGERRIADLMDAAIQHALHDDPIEM
jgi:lysophospholipase L1-like esterase